MVYSPTMGNFRLSPEEAGGGPDYMKALQAGLQGAADVYKPRTAAEGLLAKMLENKINQPKADDAQGWYETERDYRRALTKQALREPQLGGEAGLLDYLIKNKDRISQLGANDYSQDSGDYNQDSAAQQSFVDNSDNPGVSAQGPGVIQDGNAFPGRTRTPSPGQKIYQHMLDKAMGVNNTALQGPARVVDDLNRLKQMYGENSPEYQQAKDIAEADITSKQALAGQRSGSIPRLKAGESYIKDDAGKLIGVNHSPTQKESDEIAGRTFFNETYPIVNKGASLFTGEESIRRLENAAANYKTDPKARAVFDDFLLAEKLSATTAVKEAATVGAGKQKEVFNQFKDSLAKSDVPKVLQKWIKEYQIPASAQYKAGLRMQEILNRASEKSASSIPATVPRYFNAKDNKAASSNKPIKMVWQNGTLVRAE